LRRLRAFWKLQLVGIACVAVASTLSLLDPLLMKWLIDSVLPHKNLLYLGLVVAAALGAYVGRVLFQNWATLCTFGVGQKLALKLRIELFVHLERLTARFYRDNPIGDLVQRLDRDVDVICEQGTDLVPALLRMLNRSGAGDYHHVHVELAAGSTTTSVAAVISTCPISVQGTTTTRSRRGPGGCRTAEQRVDRIPWSDGADPIAPL
jgi:ABC-type multidrug transport system fused ATPase/permease subunit